MKRRDGRRARQLRPVTIDRNFISPAPGAVLISAGDTRVLCTASLQPGVPAWRDSSGCGWVTAEYDMLPGSTTPRKARNRQRLDGRTQEIQRLIGRCLRSVVDMSALGSNTLMIDCDVLQADGGTRTASITGAFVAMSDAVGHGLRHQLIARPCITDHVAAVSLGIVDGDILLDLDYDEDVRAEVDLNLVMTGKRRLVEVQATGEQSTFTRLQLEDMVKWGSRGIGQLIELQKKALHVQRS